MRSPSFSHLRGLIGPASLAAAAMTLPPSAFSDTLTASASPNALIPDGNDSGYVSLLDLPTPGSLIEDVNITLTLAGEPDGGWNGDLYIYLAHGGFLSVLVNRPGVSQTNPFGYGDNGLAQVTFDDSAPTGDFHVYQATLGLSDSDQPISGIFEPDGRTADPANVTTDDPRNALLSVFNGRSSEGEWRLFIADLVPGGSFRLIDWELTVITKDPIPIPESNLALWAGAVTFGLGAVSLVRRRRSHG